MIICHRSFIIPPLHRKGGYTVLPLSVRSSQDVHNIFLSKYLWPKSDFYRTWPWTTQQVCDFRMTLLKPMTKYKVILFSSIGEMCEEKFEVHSTYNVRYLDSWKHIKLGWNFPSHISRLRHVRMIWYFACSFNWSVVTCTHGRTKRRTAGRTNGRTDLKTICPQTFVDGT
jgi:hypothetical protein